MVKNLLARKVLLRGFMLLLLGATFGCASQSEVDALRKEIETMKSERAQHQQVLSKAVEDAQEGLDNCKLRDATNFDTAWTANSVPVKGKPGMRSGDREIANHLREEQHRADGECQRDYDNALQKAKLLYGAAN